MLTREERDQLAHETIAMFDNLLGTQHKKAKRDETMRNSKFIDQVLRLNTKDVVVQPAHKRTQKLELNSRAMSS